MRSPAEEQVFVRSVAGEIETLRLQRRAQWRDRPHPEGKRFTQEELVSEIYGAYKHLVAGRTLRIPSRADLLRIADWLECTIHETNDLLLAAQYLPEAVELRDDEEHRALEQARFVLNIIPLPGVLVTRGWKWRAHNSLFQALHPSFELQKLCDRFALDTVFNLEQPFRLVWSPSSAAYQANTHAFILLFRHLHWPFRRESWYQHHLNDMRQRYVDFSRFWKESVDAKPVATFEHCMLDPATGIVYKDKSFAITFGAASFPQLIVSAPVDRAAHHFYQQRGCQTTENRWEQILTLDTPPAAPPASLPSASPET